MAMILEAQPPLPCTATSEELLSMGLQAHVQHSQDSGGSGISSAEDEEIVLCF
jgi:hypothetical protein